MKKFVLVLGIALLGSFGLYPEQYPEDSVNEKINDTTDYAAQTGLNQLYKWRDMLKKQGYKQEVVYIQNAIDQIEKSIQEGTVAQKMEKYENGIQKINQKYADRLQALQKEFLQAQSQEEKVKIAQEKFDPLIEKINTETKELWIEIWPAYEEVLELEASGILTEKS